MRRVGGWRSALVGVAALGAGCGGASDVASSGGTARAQAVGGSPAVTNGGTADARAMSQAFVRIAAEVGPSVVRITTKERAEAAGRDRDEDAPFDGSPFDRFFGGPQQRRRPRLGMGSGVVLDDAGHI